MHLHQRVRRKVDFEAIVQKRRTSTPYVLASVLSSVATNPAISMKRGDAIRSACAKLGTFVLKGCEIYTSCEPCPMCLGAIYWARLSRVYFAGSATDAADAGFDDSFIYREFEEPAGKRTIPMVQMMRDPALEAFRAWQAKPDRIRY